MIPPSWRICDECGAKHDVERVDGRWLCFECVSAPKVAKAKPGALLLVVVLALGCAGPAFSEAPQAERFGAVGYDFPPGSQCVLLPELHYAPAGLCFRITADEWSTLAACEGTTPTNYVGKTWTNPTSYPTSSFEIEGGGCFQFYNCTPEGVLAPTVDPC